MPFELSSEFRPQGDQPEAIAALTERVLTGTREQTLLGVTGSGKTFTMANVIKNVQKPTLVIAHNKTLAAQLYAEFRQFFPKNAVHYFVSYYDYYQPEAYVPRTDTYIEKEATINDEIDRLRLASTASLLTRPDVLIVASVSCIYGIGSPENWAKMTVRIKQGEIFERSELLAALTAIHYERNEIDFSRGKLRVRGDIVEIFPAQADDVIRVELFGTRVESLKRIHHVTGEVLGTADEVVIFPAKHWLTEREKLEDAIKHIRTELDERVAYFKSRNMLIEAQRINERTNYDLEMLEQTGFCHGIENYSRHLAFRQPGEPPYTLLDYFPREFLLFVDESHMTVPQIRGMYHGDRSRKETLIRFGFRLPSALDNRPLQFPEFYERINQAIFVSATPGEFEIEKSTGGALRHVRQFYEQRAKGQSVAGIVEQIIRPTYLVDPLVEVRPTEHQIDDVLKEIRERVAKKQRVLITTLTKRMAENLTEYLQEAEVKAAYLHSDIETLERTGILRDLRLGTYDVVVGINLLREGLDLPEVSLVIILDADKESFLRDETSLIQTIGRASRHLDGRVIMYADEVTGSMRRAMRETERRHLRQEAYNKEHGITPETITKAIREALISEKELERATTAPFDVQDIPKEELPGLIKELEGQMELAAKNLQFEQAAAIRDQLFELEAQLDTGKLRKKLKRR